MAKSKFERTKPARERGDDRARGSRQDDADGGDDAILAKKYGGEAKNYDQIECGAGGEGAR